MLHPLERRFGHRTLTHSTVMLLTVAVLAALLWWINPLCFSCVVGGYWLHRPATNLFLNGKIQTAKVEPVADIEIYRLVTYSG